MQPLESSLLILVMHQLYADVTSSHYQIEINQWSGGWVEHANSVIQPQFFREWRKGYLNWLIGYSEK